MKLPDVRDSFNKKLLGSILACLGMQIHYKRGHDYVNADM